MSVQEFYKRWNTIKRRVLKNPLNDCGHALSNEIKELIKLPVVAIGGLSLSNIDKLKECNVDGYAVVSAILGAENIKLECEKWIEKI